MATIPLTQGKVAIVDDGDLPLLRSHKWFAEQTKPGRWYAATKIQRRIVPMHKFLTGNAMTDHRSHDGLDNRRSNLRKCTNQQNQANRRKQRGSSRFKGVCFVKSRGRWVAQIQVSGRHHHLGYFVGEEEAAEAYRQAAIRHFAEFAHF